MKNFTETFNFLISQLQKSKSGVPKLWPATPQKVALDLPKNKKKKYI